MKSVSSLFALFALLALSFACAPVNEQAASAPMADEPQLTVEETAFPWIDETANCCDPKPILTRPKI